MRYSDLIRLPTPELPANLVPHPRYEAGIRKGNQLIPPGAWGHWRYKHSKVFPHSAIRANPEKQRGYAIDVGYYVDCLQGCRVCGRPFVFFAEEQRYLYEVLGLPVDRWCLRCVECRKAYKHVQGRFHRYSRLAAKEKVDDKELVTLAQDTLFLWEQGLIQNRDTLNRVKNQAQKRIPNRRITQEIVEAANRAKTAK